jgi:type I restriction enzyme M protein
MEDENDDAASELHVAPMTGVSQLPGGPTVALPWKHALEEMLRTLAMDAQVGPSSQADYLKFLLCLVFLRDIAPNAWAEFQKTAYSDAEDVDLSGLVQRIVNGTDKTSRAHSSLAWMMPELERLRLRSAQRFSEVVRLVDRLEPDAFDFLLDRFEAQAQLRSADFFTPREVASLMASIAVGEANMGHSVYDPYVRGGELLCAVDSAQSISKPQLVVGESPNRETLRLAGMNLALHGLDAELRPGTGMPWDDNDQQRPLADAVLLNPPFNAHASSNRLRPDTGWPFGPPPFHSDNYAWIQYAIMSLVPGGTAAVLMPNRAGVSANRREYKIREKMVEQGAVQAVVMLPSHLFPTTEIGVTLWVVTRPSGEPSQVLFINAKEMSYKTRTRQVLFQHAAGWITELYRRRKTLAEGDLRSVPGGGLAVLAGVDALRRTKYSLNPADYLIDTTIPQPNASAARIGESLSELAKMRLEVNQADSLVELIRPHPHGALSRDIPPGWRRLSLTALCDIQAGPSYSRLGVEERSARGTVPVVMPRHLRERSIIAPDADRVSEEMAGQLAKFRLAANDILCVRSGVIGEPAIVCDEQRGWLFGTNLLRLRVLDLDMTDPMYVLGYLSLPVITRWVRDRSTGTATPSISARSLGELIISLPPLAEQDKIGSALHKFSQQIAAHREFAQKAEIVRAELAEHLMGGALILR